MNTATVPYRYTAENRLEHRHRYMYTPFEGPEFLQAYFEQRCQWREELRNLLEDHITPVTDVFDEHVIDNIVALLANPVGGNSHQKMSVFLGRSRRILLKGPGDCECQTTALLVDLWREFASNSPSEMAHQWLDILVRKFEVSKRLYSRYSIDLKPLDRRFKDLEPYVLLASLTVLLYRRGANLKFLNVTLKLIDLISSLPANACSLPQIAIASLDAEIAAIRQLMASQEVAL